MIASAMPITAPAPGKLAHLNDPQRLAVETMDGPVLVLAGAGTGKTRVLTTRLAHILQTGRAYPSQILAVTFTNKAAGEMRERVAQLLGQPVEGWWLGTFHALAARMLRNHAEKVGLTSNYTIIDEDDQVRLMKQIAEGFNIDPKKWAPKIMVDIISRWKDKGLNPSDITVGEAGEFAGGKLPMIYRAYQDRLRTVNACDFGDLLLHVINIFKNPAYQDVIADYHRRFKYILVDEYQDTNTAQYLWLRLLAAGSNNICCVGDDDQSIYGWRGAEVSNILRFERDFPGAVVVKLEENYRSTGHILGAAAGLIAHNQGRLGKTLWSSGDMGDKVQVLGVWDGEVEARTISDMIEKLKANGQKLSGIAILVRASFQMREFEDRFLSIGLPYRVFGGPRFYERAEIRDALAYFRVVSQPHDDLALERVINTPKRGLGDTTLQTLHTHARARGSSLYAAIEDLALGTALRPKVQQTLANLIRDFDRWRGQLTALPQAELAGIILDESGYTAMWQADKSPDAPGRLENLKELVATMADYDSLPAFLEHVALVLDNANNNATDQLSIMTLHAAKGLEFDTVFLPGWEDGLFPSQRTMDENGLAGLEEERRLAYVGITRAKRHAVITLAGSRRQYGNWVQNPPSRFIDELPPDHIVTNAATGMMGRAQDHTDRWAHTDSYTTGRRVIDVSDNTPYHAGARVSHGSFGEGTIIHISGNKLDIKFDDGENRRVISSFVEIIE